MLGKILLHGVFINNLMHESYEDIMQIKIYNEDTFEELEQEIHNDVFFSEQKTGVICWCCSLCIIGQITSISVSFSNETRSEFDNSYKIYHNLLDACHSTSTKKVAPYGNFCNEFCAMRFLFESQDISPESKKKYKKNLLYETSRRLGKEIFFIPLSYPKQYMKLYCGDGGWSEEEYRRRNKTLVRFYEN
jgi:hypothetical protein